MTGWYALLSGVALKSILLLGAAALVAILMRGRSAATRHIVWMAAFAGLLALPLLTVSLPALPASITFLPGAIFRTDVSPGGQNEMQPQMNADERRSKDRSLSAFTVVHRRPGLFFEVSVVW